jgi:two-component system, cell cycle sensor histidine kinase and response regulator CckA
MQGMHASRDPVEIDPFAESLDAILVLDARWIVRRANAAAQPLFDRTAAQLVGRPLAELVPRARQQPTDDPLDDLVGARTHGAIRRVTAARPDESTFPLDMSLSPCRSGGWLVVCRDASDRRRVEAELRQAQKMEAIGRLAGGIAHDLNNVLTVVRSFGEMALEDLDPSVPGHDFLRQVLKASERAAGLTRQLLAFSRRQPAIPRVITFNDVARDTEAMMRRLLREDIEFTTRLEPAAWSIKVDPGHFEQVLVNLVVNARDAIQGAGRILVSTSNVELDEEYAHVHGVALDPGEYAVLSVGDSGAGIPAELRQRIFEPFFTTKAPDKGTGLGLSTCYGIVKQARGFIWVYSEAGRGTTFKVYVPRTLDPAVVRHNTTGQIARVGGHETLLVVEDDPQVRRVAVETLTRHGYRVISASHGLEALRIVRESRIPLDLLLTDVVMPKMGGPELVERMRQQFPGLRVLFMSGYADPTGALSQQPEITALMEKPFSRSRLLERVRAVLDGTL